MEVIAIPCEEQELINIFIKRRFIDGWRYARVIMSAAAMDELGYKDGNWSATTGGGLLAQFKGGLFARDDIDYIADKSTLRQIRCADVSETELCPTSHQMSMMFEAYRAETQDERPATHRQVIRWWRRMHGKLPDAYVALARWNSL